MRRVWVAWLSIRLSRVLPDVMMRAARVHPAHLLVPFLLDLQWMFHVPNQCTAALLAELTASDTSSLYHGSNREC